MTPNTNHIARWVSIIVHPFAMALILAVVPGWYLSSRTSPMLGILLVTLTILLPLSVLMFRQVRMGRWTNVDASNKSERPVMFIVALIGFSILISWLIFNDPHSFLLRGALITTGFVVLAYALNRRIKLSMHVTFASMTATSLTILGSPIGYALIPAVPLLAWSRLALLRHRPYEIILGLFLGALCGVVLVRF